MIRILGVANTYIGIPPGQLTLPDPIDNSGTPAFCYPASAITSTNETMRLEGGRSKSVSHRGHQGTEREGWRRRAEHAMVLFKRTTTAKWFGKKVITMEDVEVLIHISEDGIE